MEHAYLELCIKGNEAGWCESQSETVCQREPVPVLGEHQNSDHRKHVGVACTWLQRHCYIAATCNHKNTILLHVEQLLFLDI
jgi:hypothetical protein